jgi:hypothetical protein
MFELPPRRLRTAAVSISCGLAFSLLGALAVASDSTTSRSASALPEKYCISGSEVLSSFYGELNAGATKDMQRLANKAEAAAHALRACAENKAADSRVETDRLRVRAADALFIAAEAHRRLRHSTERITDLRAVVRLMGNLDSRARVNSNENLYQEARLLLRFTRHFLKGAVA